MLPPSPVIWWKELGSKPKWLPLNSGYHDVNVHKPHCLSCKPNFLTARQDRVCIYFSTVSAQETVLHTTTDTSHHGVSYPKKPIDKRQRKHSFCPFSTGVWSLFCDKNRIMIFTDKDWPLVNNNKRRCLKVSRPKRVLGLAYSR